MESTAPIQDRTSVADKVAFLRSAASYPHAPQKVDVVETHAARTPFEGMTRQ